MADIVDDFLTRLANHLPETPAEVRLTIEREVRSEWGGAKPYVAKQLSRVTRATLLAHGLRQQRPMSEIFAMASVSRRTGYRMLGNK
jgi:phytoene/squalene synthetase